MMKNGFATNLNKKERFTSIVGGCAFLLMGLHKALGRASTFEKAQSALLLAASAGLLQRGITGRCYLYDSLDINTAFTSIKVDKSVVIRCPVEDIWKYLRDLNNIPGFVDHIETVTMIDNRRAYWKSRSVTGNKMEWQTEIISERENQILAWNSLKGEVVENFWCICLESTATEKETSVRLILEYCIPTDELGNHIDVLFGRDPNQLINEDLRRLKRLLESRCAKQGKGTEICR